jgi:uncharacterized RDD family membrane protein YckC
VSAPDAGAATLRKHEAFTLAGMGRRLAAMVYEAVILFGVLMVSGLIFSPLADQRHALEHRQGLQAFLFLVLAAYFIGFWSHGGQTIAAKTWQVRVVMRDGSGLTPWRACARFLLAWSWFVPALAWAGAMGWHEGRQLYGALALGMLGYLLLAWCLPDRQFLHDQLCRTRLAYTPSPGKH